MRPADPIVVSFVGSTEFDGLHVHPTAGDEFDWRFLAALPVLIVTKPGIDCRDSIRSIFAQAELYPTLADIETQVCGSVISPRDIWLHGRTSESWKALFA